MILITGGAGFIGSHITRTLAGLGEQCLVVRRGAAGPSTDSRIVVEQVDVADREALLRIGDRHEITGIVNLVGVFGFSALQPVQDARMAIGSLLNVLEAAVEWEVPRVGTASTIGVYGGAIDEMPLPEDALLPMATGHGIPAFKKIAELLADHLARTTGVEIVNYRIAGAWGPGGRPASPFIAAPQLVHAATQGTVPDLSGLLSPAHTGDGIDLIYVKDCARAIAHLQLAEKLNHSTYNVASGRVTTNGEIAGAIRKIIPDAHVDLPEGSTSPAVHLDITRLKQDTGYEPQYDTDQAVADYIDWLRAGNPR
jgi:UDP-glucose 4-epimerase